MEVGQPLKTGLTEVEARQFAKQNKGVDEVIVQNDQGTFDVYAADQLDPKTLETLKVGSATTTVIFEVEKKGGPGSAARIPQKDFEAAAGVLGVVREPGESTVSFNKRVQSEVNRTLLRATPPDYESLLVVDGLAGPLTLEAVKKAYAIKSQKIETSGLGENDDHLIARLKVVTPPPPPKPVVKAEGQDAAKGQPTAPKPTFTAVVGQTTEGNYTVIDAGTGLARPATDAEKALIDKKEPPKAESSGVYTLAPVTIVGEDPQQPFVIVDDNPPIKPLFGPGGTLSNGGVGVISPDQSKAYGIDQLFDPTNPKKTIAIPLDANGLPLSSVNEDPFGLGAYKAP